jgi:type IV secretory pathway TrbF-like protein
MRSMGWIGMLLALLLTGWLVKQQLKSSVTVPVVQVPAASAGAQAVVVPMTQVPQQVQKQLDGLAQQQRNDLDQAVDKAEGSNRP